MPKKENMKLGEFFYLIPEEQKMRLLFLDMMVDGTQDSIACIANDEINNMTVINVEAEDGFLKVWVKDENA